MSATSSARRFLRRLQEIVGGEPGAQRQTTGGTVAAFATRRRSMLSPSDRLCAITDVGRVRDHNEDLFHVSDDARIMIVADGMGGHLGGEDASSLAVAAIEDHLGAALRCLADDGGGALQQAMRSAMDAAQERVLAAGRSHERGHEMGCTLVLKNS